MIGATVKKVGFEKINREITKMSTRCQKPFENNSLSEYVGSRGIKEIVQHFRDEKGPSRKWKKLAKSTLARRKTRGKILQVNGLLRGSIAWQVLSSSAMKLIAQDKKSSTHNYGRPPTGGFRAAIPQRQFMYLPRTFLKRIASVFQKYVIEGKAR